MKIVDVVIAEIDMTVEIAMIVATDMTVVTVVISHASAAQLLLNQSFYLAAKR
jgi:hypothetical protein